MSFPVITFRVKVTLLLCGVIVLLGVIAVVHARNDMDRILGEELERRGFAIAKDLAANSGDHLLTGDLVGLYDLANRTKLYNPDVRYILVLGPSREVRVNTFGAEIPRDLIEANMLVPGQTEQLRRLRSDEALIRDIAVPVLGGQAGTVRLGMSDAYIRDAVRENMTGLGTLVALAVAIGLIVSYGLAFYLTRPLNNLLEAVKSVTGGNFSERIPFPGKDEVGELGRAFNSMAEALGQKEAARRALLEKVISSQEEERKRVARELHDELAQQLTSVLLSLEAISASLPDSNGQSSRTLQQAIEVVSSSLAETRKLIGDLRPSVLDDLGLVPAIRSYAEARLHPLSCKVAISATGIPHGLPTSLETAIFRIVQEAVNNIVKHSRAGSARIVLRPSYGALYGEVSDDGQGFRPDQVRAAGSPESRGLGLQGMQERAELLGGSLSVRSGPGRGTRISFSIPLQQDWGEQSGQREDSLIAG